MRELAYDTECSGLRVNGPAEELPFGYSTGTMDGETAWHRFGTVAKRRSAAERENLAGLDRLWTPGSDFLPVMHNAKFDLGMTAKILKRDDGILDRPFHDTFIMSALVQSDHPSHALKELAWEIGGISTEDEKALKPYVSGGRSYELVPDHKMRVYGKQDAYRTMFLYQFFRPKLEADAKRWALYEMEKRLILVTMSMERRGVQLNVPAAERYIAKLEADVEEVLRELEGRCGRRLNPAAPKDLNWLLFKHLALPVVKRTGKTGAPATDKVALAQYREMGDYPEIECVLRYRAWSRGRSTIQSYIDLADGEGVLHPNIKTIGARTGRESCSEPNLQNVEKEGVLLNPYPVAARRVFRPRPGYVNFHIDYSGIELRLLVHYSQERAFIDCINTGGDPHALSASAWFGDEFTKLGEKDPQRKVLRGASKNATFAVFYGAGINKIALIFDRPIPWAARRYAFYKHAFPKTANLNRDLARRAEAEGFVRTEFGRVVHVPPQEAYVATNYLIQGTAADVLKYAQVNVHDWLRKAGLLGEVNPLLPIHDEIIIEVPRRLLPDAPEIMLEIRRVMTDFGNVFRVPMDVEVLVATADWANKEPYPLLPF